MSIKPLVSIFMGFHRVSMCLYGSVSVLARWWQAPPAPRVVTALLGVVQVKISRLTE